MEQLLENIDGMLVLQTVLIIIVAVVINRIISLKRELTDMRINLLTIKREQSMQYKSLLEQIQKQSDKSRALDELQRIFDYKMRKIRSRYPALTDADAQVLLLIGLGVENHDILALTNMSKRTYYKRRQVLAQRMNTTAAQLDEMVQSSFNFINNKS